VQDGEITPGYPARVFAPFRHPLFGVKERYRDSPPGGDQARRNCNLYLNDVRLNRPDPTLRGPAKAERLSQHATEQDTRALDDDLVAGRMVDIGSSVLFLQQQDKAVQDRDSRSLAMSTFSGPNVTG
jgi:hypothetical protein